MYVTYTRSSSKRVARPQFVQWTAELKGKFPHMGRLDANKLIDKKSRMAKVWSAWKYLKKQTGLGWDPISGALLADDAFWETFLLVTSLL